MPYIKKYKKGRKIESFTSLKYFLNTRNFVYINDKILHKGWVLSLQLRYLIYAMDRGQITVAIKTKRKGEKS